MTVTEGTKRHQSRQPEYYSVPAEVHVDLPSEVPADTKYRRQSQNHWNGAW